MSEQKLPAQEEILWYCEKLTYGLRKFLFEHGYIVTEEFETELTKELLELFHRKMSDKNRLSKEE